MLSIILVIMLVHFATLTGDYLANKTRIDVRIAEARELEFPAVTVCNANPIKKSALVALSENNPLLQQLVDLEAGNTQNNKKKRRRKRSAYHKHHVS